MGIQVEFNPDLALRNIKEYKEGRRTKDECIPEELKAKEAYYFLKRGQRNYWLEGEIPLLETKGDGQLSKPLASIVILQATHCKINEKLYTLGQYLVKEVYDINDEEIHFNGFQKVK